MRLWLVTGAMERDGDIQLFSYVWRAETEAEARGDVLKDQQEKFPQHGARAVRVTDITAAARQFAADHPENRYHGARPD